MSNGLFETHHRQITMRLTLVAFSCCLAVSTIYTYFNNSHQGVDGPLLQDRYLMNNYNIDDEGSRSQRSIPRFISAPFGELPKAREGKMDPFIADIDDDDVRLGSFRGSQISQSQISQRQISQRLNLFNSHNNQVSNELKASAVSGASFNTAIMDPSEDSRELANSGYQIMPSESDAEAQQPERADNSIFAILGGRKKKGDDTAISSHEEADKVVDLEEAFQNVRVYRDDKHLFDFSGLVAEDQYGSSLARNRANTADEEPGHSAFKRASVSAPLTRSAGGKSAGGKIPRTDSQTTSSITAPTLAGRVTDSTPYSQMSSDGKRQVDYLDRLRAENREDVRQQLNHNICTTRTKCACAIFWSLAALGGVVAYLMSKYMP